MDKKTGQIGIVLAGVLILAVIAYYSVGQTQSIVGEANVTKGQIYTYTINLVASVPDKDYTDGSYDTQYAYWVLMNSSKIVVAGETTGLPVPVNGIFTKTVSVVIPSTGKYVLTAFITEIPSTYSGSTWTNGAETIIVKEAKDISSKITYTAPPVPIPSGFDYFKTLLMSWITTIYSWFI